MLEGGTFWPDMVLEIEPAPPSSGRVVWEWHAWDHLVQDFDVARANHGDIAAHPERIDLNFDRERELGYVGDAKRPQPPGGPSRAVRGGDLLVRYGNPRVQHADGEQRLFGQHDVRWITSGLPGAGHVLVFNNGDRRARDSSSVDELAILFDEKTLRGKSQPKIELAWTYTSPDIYAPRVSSAQRLASGNTLVCAGETGRLVEVDANGKVVWDYLSPLGGDAPMPSPFGRGRPPMIPPGGARAFPPAREGDGAGREIRGPPGGFWPPGGGLGPIGPHAIFRAWRYPPNYAGLAALAKKTGE